MNDDDLQLLADFRGEVPGPDEATAERIYQLATATRPARRRPFGLDVPRRPRLVVATATATPGAAPLRFTQRAGRRRLIALSAGAAAALSLAGALVGLTLSASAPENAYAAAKKAIAATSAGALDSGTMTLTRSTADGSTVTVITVRWNGDDIAIASAEGLPGFDQLLLVAGGVYVQRADGSWLHYASKADLGPLLYAGTVQAARGLAAGSRAAQIIASAYGLQKTVQPDGSTVYSGAVPPSNPAEVAPGNDTGTQIMLPGFGPGGTLQLVVGSDGLVRQMSETASPPLDAAWRIEYSQLGSTRPITTPAAYAEGTPGDLPGPPRETAPDGDRPVSSSGGGPDNVP